MKNDQTHHHDEDKATDDAADNSTDVAARFPKMSVQNLNMKNTHKNTIVV